MFYDNQTNNSQVEYQHLLRVVGALSKLSSDSDIPYLYYRMAENIFCRAFEATNLSRSDISIDASKGLYGIGLKTFLYKNGCCVEKVAEFNKERHIFSQEEYKDIKQLIEVVCSLRNERITTTTRITGVSLDKLLYHCVVRNKGKFLLYETPMECVNISDIHDIRKSTDNTIYFNDNKSEYCFNISKSTLFKRFEVDALTQFDVPILDDPFEVLYNLLDKPKKSSVAEKIFVPQEQIKGRVVLPLYSNKGGMKFVPERSGLNQWNAKGRERDANEVYIPVPAWIHKAYPNFFPKRDTPFDLILPDNKVLSAKICQDGGKALMTNPNKDLGKWLLRQVLHLKEGELLTYEMLERIGIDSIEISKTQNNEYHINFKSLGTYERFMSSEETDDD